MAFGGVCGADGSLTPGAVQATEKHAGDAFTLVVGLISSLS